ncbi:hypothetical protein G7Y89_g7863 [Cudoniella acicularis]|uniref:MARVEL domain-containing protein n=1 Tax=Cudoniella acicularis TaxID=354080 RepID=A0A8H4RHQ2_9HELO|nr:hypothetical protein G7Y89_g7863 [Cudoniella acicularis]
MAFDLGSPFIFPLRIAQVIFAIIVLGIMAYVVNWFNTYAFFLFASSSPSQANFLLFTSIWTLLVLVYLIIAPVRFQSFAHKYAILGVESGLDVCGASEAGVAFSAFEWLLFLISTAMAAMHCWNTKDSSNTTHGPAIEVQHQPGGTISSPQVFIATRSTSGIGRELSKILYAHHAKVYLATCSPEKASATIETLKKAHPESKGGLVFLKLDLDDLTTIKASAQEFLSKEARLGVICNNAGVMLPPPHSKTKQGYELQLGTNTIGPFLLTKLLTPFLVKTAKISTPGAVRAVWVLSSAARTFAPVGSVDMGNLDFKK